MKKLYVVLIFTLLSTIMFAQQGYRDYKGLFVNPIVIGSDGSGFDATFWSGTSGAFMQWDASAKNLNLTNSSLTVDDGIILPTASSHIWAVGGSVVLATAGADIACANGTRFWSEIMIPYTVTLTGISYLVGSVGGTDSVVVQLVNSAGTEVATSRLPGEAADIVGTTAQFQSVAFSSTYSAKPGIYYIVVQFNGTNAKFRAYTIAGSKFIAGSASGTWGTAAGITPGTTFTADKGPIAITY